MGQSPPALALGAQFAPGTRLGRYELLATIGKGGMASVILARQRGPAGFEKTVVVKVIHPHMASDRTAINMLLDEARVAAQIDHPNVVHTYELGEAHGTFYIVMEYLAGESFARILKKAASKVPPPLAPTVAGRIVADAAAGLSAAHQLVGVDGRPLDIVHRDVSPGNIVVLYNGSVKVVDFGIAKAAGRVTSTQDGELKGKYGYMSPEQIRNEVMDARSDVFSLGVVLWEALALRRLFQADNVAATLMQILTSQRVAPSTYQPEVPRALDQIALQALAPDPRDRFQTMAEMHKAIEDAIWQSRTGANEVQTQMQWWFSDRIEARRALLSRATTTDTPLDEVEVDQIGQAFNNQSGTLPPVPLPPMPGQPLHTFPTSRPSMSMRQPPPYMPTQMFNVHQRRSNRRTVFAIAVLGTIIGVLAAVLVTGGGADDPVKPDVVVSGNDKPSDPKPADPTPADPKPADPKPNSGATAEPIKVPEPVREELVDPTENITRGDVATPTIEKPDTTKPDTTITKPDIKKPDPPKPPVKPKQSSDELYKTGTDRFLAGDFAGAEQAYRQVLAQDRNHAGAHRGLGFVYQRTGQKAKALAELRLYLKLNPNAKDAASIRKRIQELE
jgi:serine/threonine protein kinase